MDILDDMGVSKLSAKVFLKVNYSFKLACNLFNSIYATDRSDTSQHVSI